MDDSRRSLHEYELTNEDAPVSPCPDRTVIDDLDKHWGSLSPEQRWLFVRHLGECKRCTAKALEIRYGLSSAAQEVRDNETFAMYLRFGPSNMTVADRYRVRAPLGRGGMGEVYLADDVVTDRRVALKVVDIQWLRDGGFERHLRWGENTFRERLRREAQVMAKLSHPNLCQLHDVVPFGQELCIVMEHVPGTTLTQWLKAKQRSWREILDVFLQAGEGLRAAHGAGLVHRDFKPDNVLIRKDQHVVVTDFGVARSINELSDEGSAEPSTVTPMPPRRDPLSEKPPQAPRDLVGWLSTTSLHGLIGTRAYVAPEQRLGQAQDARADQYSFAVALYEALYSQRPYVNEQPDEQGAELAPLEPPANTDAPAWLWPPICRALSRQPGGRFSSMGAFLRELRNERTTPATKRAWMSSRVAAVAAAAAVLLVAVSAGAWIATTKVRCDVPAEPFAGVWDGAVTYRMGAALLSGGNPNSEATFNKLADGLDEYEHRWKRAYEQTCAARVEGRLSENDFRVQQLCLEDERRSVQALTRTASEEGDEKALTNALKAVWLLTPPEQCSEPYRLSSFKTLASGESRMTNAEEREGLQFQIKRACALNGLAKYDKGIDAAQAAIGAINANATYGALLPQALFCLAKNQYAKGAFKEAQESARQVTQLAAYNGNGALYGSMSSQLAWWTAHLRDPQEVLALVSYVHPDVVPDQASEQYDFAHALAAMGVANARKGDPDKGASLLWQSVALMDGIVGRESPQAINMWSELGFVLRDAGQPQAALGVIDEAIDRGGATLGRDHFFVGWMTGVKADALRMLGRRAEAEAAAKEALSTITAALGPSHPYSARAEMLLAYLALDRGEVGPARPLLAHALSVMEQQLGRESGPAGEVVVGWGRAYLAAGNLQQAIAAFGRALANLDKDPSSAWIRAEAQLGLATALWRSGRDAHRARVLAAEARRYFHAHDPAARFLTSAGGVEVAEAIR